MIRHGWNGIHADITQKRQRMLPGVSRTTVYAKRRPVVVVWCVPGTSFAWFATIDSWLPTLR